MSDLTHFNKKGEAHMVNVGEKAQTKRMALARGSIEMEAATLAKILAGDHKKGDVLGIARIAGIMAAKRTSDLIPLCHPLPLTAVEIDFETQQAPPSVIATARAETIGQTGVEMEALCAVQIALLTIYDMCKAVDRGMVMGDIRLEEKQGGKSGHWKRS